MMKFVGLLGPAHRTRADAKAYRLPLRLRGQHVEVTSRSTTSSTKTSRATNQFSHFARLGAPVKEANYQRTEVVPRAATPIDGQYSELAPGVLYIHPALTEVVE
jgi:hypothetical protein